MKLKMSKEEALQKVDEWGLPGLVKSHAVAFILSKKGAISIGQLISFVAIVIVLYIMTIILGNLEGPMTDAVAGTSMATIATSIQTTSASAMGLAGILPIIAVAVIMLGAVQMLRGGGSE
jgi:uncharacterized protein (UPF0333 family)